MNVCFDSFRIKKVIDQCKHYNVPVYVDQCHVNGKIVMDDVDFPEELRVREIPWKKEQNPNKVFLLNGKGSVERIVNGYLFYSPVYVYDYWKRTFTSVEKMNMESPLAFSEIKESGRIRNILNSVHDFISKSYFALLESGAKEDEAAKILPKDTFIKFFWKTNSIDKMVLITEDRFITFGNEIKQYMKAVKSLN